MQLSEDEYTEFKKTTAELTAAMNDISAMLNKHGNGTLYFGMKNDGTPYPFTINDSTLRDISRKIYESIKPQIYPNICKKMVDSTTVVEISFHGEDIPYSAFGRYYTRVADENRELTPSELRKLMIAKEYSTNWEKKQSDCNLNDIDEETLQTFYNKAVNSGRLSTVMSDKTSLLTRLGLTAGDKLNNAGKYLFSKNKPLVLKTAVFATDSKLTFLDINRVEGNIFQLINEAMKYVQANIRWKAEVIGISRQETPEIPIEALREIIVNSFAHARYDCPVQHEIDIFANRISVTNPGDFANEFSPEEYADFDLKSVLRNELIAKALYLCREVETFGSGLKKIYSLCRSAGIEPKYQRFENHFTFELNRQKDNVVKNAATNVVLSTTELAVLKLIESNPKNTAETIGKELVKNPRTIQRILKTLKDKGCIQREGANKTGYWKII